MITFRKSDKYSNNVSKIEKSQKRPKLCSNWSIGVYWNGCVSFVHETWIDAISLARLSSILVAVQRYFRTHFQQHGQNSSGQKPLKDHFCLWFFSPAASIFFKYFSFIASFMPASLNFERAKTSMQLSIARNWIKLWKIARIKYITFLWFFFTHFD